MVNGPEFNRDSLFTKVEIDPEPREGLKAFRDWMRDNYIMPQKAFENKVQGTVMIRFIVEKDGSFSNYEIIKDQGYGTGNAAIELLKRVQKWTQPIFYGRPVRMKYVLPIRLDIEKMKVDTIKTVR